MDPNNVGQGRCINRLDVPICEDMFDTLPGTKVWDGMMVANGEVSALQEGASCTTGTHQVKCVTFGMSGFFNLLG